MYRTYEEKFSTPNNFFFLLPFLYGTEIRSRVIHGVVVLKSAEIVLQLVLKRLDVEIHVIVKWRTVSNDQSMVSA
jgi:hypothetical protein